MCSYYHHFSYFLRGTHKNPLNERVLLSSQNTLLMDKKLKPNFKLKDVAYAVSKLYKIDNIVSNNYG